MKNLMFWRSDIWWAERVRQSFDRGEINKKSKFRSFLLVVTLTVIFTEISYLFLEEATTNEYDPLLSLSFVLGYFLGIIYLYRRHKQETSFIEKYFVLFIPTIPVLIVQVVIPLYLVYFVGLSFIYGDVPEATTLADVIFSLVVTSASYWRVGKYFS